MRVLLISQGGPGNLGDECIRRCLEKLLMDAGCQVDWQKFSGHYNTTAGPGHNWANAVPMPVRKLLRRVVPAELRWALENWRSLEKRLVSCPYDLILIGGGQLIQSNGSFGPALFLWTTLCKRLHRKRVLLFGVGTAEHLTSVDQWLFGRVLKRLDGVYVRDRAALSVMSRSFGISAQLVPDAGFYINRVYPQSAKKERRALFFPVDYGFYQRKSRNQMPTMDEPTYFRCWEERILKYLDEGFEAALACSARDTDLPAVEKLLLRMSGQHGTELDFLDLRSLKDLTSEVARSEAIVSGRMHPLLMGHCYGCRLDPFVTSRKIASFQEEYVQGNFNTAEIQSRIEDTIRRVL